MEGGKIAKRIFYDLLTFAGYVCYYLMGSFQGSYPLRHVAVLVIVSLHESGDLFFPVDHHPTLRPGLVPSLVVTMPCRLAVAYDHTRLHMDFELHSTKLNVRSVE